MDEIELLKEIKKELINFSNEFSGVLKCYKNISDDEKRENREILRERSRIEEERRIKERERELEAEREKNKRKSKLNIK